MLQRNVVFDRASSTMLPDAGSTDSTFSPKPFRRPLGQRRVSSWAGVYVARVSQVASQPSSQGG